MTFMYGSSYTGMYIINERKLKQFLKLLPMELWYMIMDECYDEWWSDASLSIAMGLNFPSDISDTLEAFYRNNSTTTAPQDIALTQISRSQYNATPNKLP